MRLKLVGFWLYLYIHTRSALNTKLGLLQACKSYPICADGVHRRKSSPQWEFRQYILSERRWRWSRGRTAKLSDLGALHTLGESTIWLSAVRHLKAIRRYLKTQVFARKLSPGCFSASAHCLVCNAEHKQNDRDFIHLFPRRVMYLFESSQNACPDQNLTTVCIVFLLRALGCDMKICQGKTK